MGARDLPVEEWGKYQALLPGAVDDETWSELGDLYYGAEPLRAKFASEDPDKPLEERHFDQLRECLRAVAALHKPLQVVAQS